MTEFFRRASGVAEPTTGAIAGEEATVVAAAAIAMLELVRCMVIAAPLAAVLAALISSVVGVALGRCALFRSRHSVSFCRAHE